MSDITAISYVSGTSTTALLGDTIGANLAATVARHPDRAVLVDVATGRRWTYAQFAAEVELVARGLLALGLGKGDRVGIWAPNCAEWTRRCNTSSSASATTKYWVICRRSRCQDACTRTR